MKHITEILLLLFLIITFLQSGLDKLLDWKGNVGWLKDHFSKTFLSNMVPFSVAIILMVEMVASILCLIGIYQLIANNDKAFGFYGAILSCIALLMLLLGQRVAKDYDGARTIAIYFVPAIFAVFLLSA